MALLSQAMITHSREFDKMSSVVLIPKLELEEELRACRVCLATDTKLFYLPTHPLADTFDVLTGTPFSANDCLPQYICSVCSSLLYKSSSFRDKCSSANRLLQVLSKNQLITTNEIRQLNRTHLKHNLCMTNTQNIDLIPTGDQKPNKIANKRSLQIDTTLDIDADDSIVLDYDESSKHVIKSDDDDGHQIKSDYDSELCIPDTLIGIDKEVLKVSKTYFLEIDSVIPKTKTNNVFSKTNTEIDSDISEKNTKTVRDRKRKPVTKEIVKSENESGTMDLGIKRKRRKMKDSGLSVEQVAELEETCNVEVVIYTKEEQRKQIEARKETQEYLKSEFKCQVCFAAFPVESKFKDHLAVHDLRRGAHVCDVCLYRFSNEKKMRDHRRLHKMRITCNECHRVFNTIAKAKEHYAWHKGVKFECVECKKCFSSMQSKIQHNRCFHGCTPCGVCGDSLMGEVALRLHMKRCHKEAVDAVCSTCSLQFLSMDALSKHACEPDAMPCAHCGHSFATEELLKEHLREQHFIEELKCAYCLETFRNERLYRLHCLRLHSSRLRRAEPHKRTSNKVVCEICGGKYQSRVALTEHQRIHTGEKPFQCDYCSKSFRTKFQLQYHITTHTGERAFHCPECPKAFKSPIARRRHLLVHTKERPYACQLCGKTFQQSGSVKVHIRTVHLKEKMPRRIRPPRKNK